MLADRRHSGYTKLPGFDLSGVKLQPDEFLDGTYRVRKQPDKVTGTTAHINAQVLKVPSEDQVFTAES